MAQELAVVEKKPSGQLAKLKKKKKKQQLTPLDRFGKPIKKPTFNKQELQEAVRRLAPGYNEMPRVPHEFGQAFNVTNVDASTKAAKEVRVEVRRTPEAYDALSAATVLA